MVDKRIVTICGIRPDFIRLSQIIKGLDDSKDINHVLLHTGQHFQPSMDSVFFSEFGLRNPDINLGIGRDSQTAMEQIGILFPRLERTLERLKPGAVVYLGDTNTAVSAIVPARMGIPVIRIEAGMRAYDNKLPEEINRKAVDAIADLKICYLHDYKYQLILEGHEPESIVVTGNPIVDVVNWGLKKYNIVPFDGNYILATFHRANNILDPCKLDGFISLINRLSELGRNVVFSCYYRTMSQIQKLGLKLNSNIDVREPTNFGKFLRLEAESSMILTDSGTSQEESFLLRKPCLVLRDATERPETMLSRGGNATLWEGDQNFVENNISTINGLFSQDFTNMDTSIYGNGDASKNIVNAINRYMNRNYSDYGTRRYVVKRWEL